MAEQEADEVGDGSNSLSFEERVRTSGIELERLSLEEVFSIYDKLEGIRRNKAGMPASVESGIDEQMQKTNQSFLPIQESSDHRGNSDHQPPSKDKEFSFVATDEVPEPERFSLDDNAEDYEEDREDNEDDEGEDSFHPTLLSHGHRGNPDFRPPLKEDEFVAVTTGEAVEAERFFLDSEVHVGDDEDYGDSFLPTLQSWDHLGNPDDYPPSNEEEFTVVTTGEALAAERFFVDDDADDDEEDSFLDTVQSWVHLRSSTYRTPSKDEECIVVSTENTIETRCFFLEWLNELLEGSRGLTEAEELDEKRSSESCGEQAKEQHHTDLVEGCKMNVQAQLKLLRGAMIQSLVFGLYCLDMYMWGL